MSADSWRCLLIIAVLAVVSAVISFARGYLDAQNSKKLERDAEEKEIGNAKKMAEFFLNREQKVKDTLWATQMLLLVFESLMLGVLCYGMTDKIREAVGGSRSFVFLCILTFFIFGLLYAFLYIVFIRRIFSAWGTLRGKKTQRYRSYAMVKVLYVVSLPFASLCDFFTKAFVNLLGIGAQVFEEDVTQDEILTLVDMGEETGAIESGEKEMIENVFEFKDVTAGELLTHRTAMTAVPLDISEKQLNKIIEETGYSRIPVYDEDIDNVVGILSTKRYLIDRLHMEKERKTLKDLLYTPYFVPESVHATNLLSEMRKNKIHMAVVVDEYGGTAGIITMEDLLEEIVGNIYDETDDPVTDDEEIVKISENCYKAKGSTEIEKFCAVAGVNVPDDREFDTLASLVFSFLTVIPDDGTHPEVDCFGMHIRVEKIFKRRIEEVTVLVTRESPEEE